MIPAPFDYVRADSVEDALAVLGEHGEAAKVLAGGHSLIPLMKLRLATPTLLVDVGPLTELDHVRDSGDHVAVGALTRHRRLEIDQTLRQQVPLLCAAAARVGDPQVRHRGTIGGSLAHGDPASDLPAAALALGATMVVRGPAGERLVPAADFFRGFLDTALGPDELLTEVRFPKAAGAGWSFQKLSRRAQDWAIVGVAAVRAGDGGDDGAAGGGGGADGAARCVRVALVNMGPTPLRATAVERAVAEGASPEEAAGLAADGTEPSADVHATVEFRRHLARVLVRRALEEAR